MATELGYHVYRAGSWERVRFVPRERQAQAAFGVAFSADSRVMAVVSSLTVVRLIDTATWLPLARLQPPEADEIGSLIGFTPDGSRLAVSADGHIQLWDLRLIRERLGALGLDWDQPPYPPATDRPARPIRVDIDSNWVALQNAVRP